MVVEMIVRDVCRKFCRGARGGGGGGGGEEFIGLYSGITQHFI